MKMLTFSSNSFNGCYFIVIVHIKYQNLKIVAKNVLYGENSSKTNSEIVVTALPLCIDEYQQYLS